jgi:hypothetical protein
MGRDLFWVQVSRLSFEYLGVDTGTFFSLLMIAFVQNPP